MSCTCLLLFVYPRYWSTTHVLQCSVWEESPNTPLLSRPSGLELGRDVVISGARVIQLIGAILPRAVSLVIGLVGDMGGGGRQHAPVVNLKDGPWSRLFRDWKSIGKDTGSSSGIQIWRSHRQSWCLFWIVSDKSYSQQDVFFLRLVSAKAIDQTQIVIRLLEFVNIADKDLD